MYPSIKTLNLPKFQVWNSVLNTTWADNFSMFLNGEYMDSEDKSTGDQLSHSTHVWRHARFELLQRAISPFDAMLKYAADMDKNPEGTFTTDSYTTVDYLHVMISTAGSMLSVGY